MTVNNPNTPDDSPDRPIEGEGVERIVANTERKAETAIQRPKTIEIAGYTILAMPLESMGLTPEQTEVFRNQGGLINPTREEVYKEKARINSINEGKDPTNKNNDLTFPMYYWNDKSFENRSVFMFNKSTYTLNGVEYHRKEGDSLKGFEGWQYCYLEILKREGWENMTEEEARRRGLYPIIHYRSFGASIWMAEMYGGHLAGLSDGSYLKGGKLSGELGEIYNAAPGETNLQKLAAMGQVPIGRQENASLGNVGIVGGSYSLDENGCIYSLELYRDNSSEGVEWFSQQIAMSGVVVVSKVKHN